MITRLLAWLNERVGYVRLQVKLLIAFALLSGVPLAIGGFVGTNVAVSLVERQVIERLNAEVDTLQASLDALLRDAAADLEMLSTAPEVGLAEMSSDRASLTAAFGRYVRAKPRYLRLRVLDSAGVELARAQSVGYPIRSGTGAAQPYYGFLLANVEPGDMVYSSVELSWGSTAASLPAVSLARGVYSLDGELTGILVLDLSASTVFPEVDAWHRPGERVIVVDSIGRYLYDSGYRGDWNRFLAERAGLKLDEQYVGVAERILSGKAGQTLRANGNIVVFRPVLKQHDRHLVLVRSVPRHAVSEAVRSIRMTFLSLMGGSVLLAVALSYVGASQFTVPIQELASGARRFAKHDYSHRIELGNFDELADLATTFNSMAETIGTRDRQILAQNEALESQVRQRTAEVLHSERLAAVGEMVAGIAHEIGTPLNVISGYAEDIRGDRAGECLGDDLDIIISETRRIADLVRGLQDFARPHPPTFAHIDVGDAAREAVQLVTPTARKAGVALTVVVSGEAASSSADPHDIKQAILNLVVNAIHASNPEGRVSVDVTGEESEICIAVTDEGEGMAEEVQRQIFEPFFTTKLSGEGTGLGLAIVRRIVERHGGTISVQSHPGVGSSFQIAIPRKEHDESRDG